MRNSNTTPFSIPVIAIVGRPNVGKSTLFNELTRSRKALVVDLPGVTRDRQYGEGRLGDRPFIVIDTGGLGFDSAQIDILTQEQAWTAIEEADTLFFMVDARSGLNAQDEKIASKLRMLGKPVQLIVNKTEGLDPDIACADFYALGLSEPIPISASHGRGVRQLIENTLEAFHPEKEEQAEELAINEDDQENEEKDQEKQNQAGNQEEQAEEERAQDERIQIAIIGRPNVGKSTLVNRILGEERVVVLDLPGTTRDSIDIPFEREGQKYTIIDTAGVRRRARITEVVEKFSVVKALQAIKAADVVILLFDAKEGVTDQDLALLGFVIEAGKAVVIAVNKWDGLTASHKEEVKKTLDYRLSFADFAKVHTISALHGTGVGHLFESVHKAYQSARQDLSTSVLTRILEEAIKNHQPPMVHARRIKLRYAHAGGHQPPLIVIHGNQTEHIPDSYKRYLINTFRTILKLEGTPIRIEFKSSKNPYAGKRNPLTPRQQYKRKRLKKFVKRK